MSGTRQLFGNIRSRFALQFTLGLLGLLLSRGPAHAQLAITEVMSVASTNSGAAFAPQNSDYWELTNFGTNHLRLDGYRWNDASGGFEFGDASPFENLTIGPGESIVFVQTDSLTNVAQFLEWWGTEVLQVPIVFYAGNGFNAGGDGVWLWDPDGSLVDSVEFGQALRGYSFTYDADTGLFGALSQADEGAFKAATRDDIGSPGSTTGSVPLQVETSLSNLTVCAGIDATFVVRARGLPRPRYQWFFSGSELVGETSAELKVSNPQLANAGSYWVLVRDEFKTIESEVVTLSISDGPAGPQLFEPLSDIEVLVTETARFSALVCASPPPTFQWFANSAPMARETNRTLTISNCQLAQSGTRYCVVASNQWGIVNGCAQLTVRLKPHLSITEVMASPATNGPKGYLHGDWFELTNLDTNTVNLQGYRFANELSFIGAQVVEQPLALAPGQSAIFVEKITPQAFRAWWGEALPPDLAIITLPTFGLKNLGEEIYVWSAGAESPLNPNSLITRLSYATPEPGVTFYFEEGDEVCHWGCPSVDGERGTFRSAERGDLGSPGYVTDLPLRLIGIARDARGVTLRWLAVPARRYRIERKGQFMTSWELLHTETATNSLPSWTDPAMGGASTGFYRVVEAQ